MKKLNLIALLLGAALFLGFGVTTASAEGMKCGPGKCGSAMMDKPLKACDKADCKCGPECKCGSDCKCDDNCKCADGTKCSSIKAPVKAMKCGAGKCGSK